MIKFGPSGNSLAFSLAGFTDTEKSAVWVKEMGLDAFEYSFGRGVNLSTQKAEKIKKAFEENNIEISVHAPYFINFANTDDEMVEKSYKYVLDSCKMGKIMGAKRVVFHPSSQGKLSREDAVNLTYKRLEILAQKIIENGYDDMIICPETMGKFAQIGTTKEIAKFCTIAPFFYPCIDFGHINCRTLGGLKTVEDFLKELDVIEDILGREKLENMHVHFSKIMYSQKGEVKHLTFEDASFGPDPELFIKAIIKKGAKPYVISESAGTQDIDALTMKNIYKSLIN